MIGRIVALAWSGMRQALRDKVLYVLVGFCVLLITGSLVVSQLTVGERARIVMNLGLTATSVLANLTAIFVTINQVGREIDRRSIVSILVKPVARWEVLVGRFAGMAITLFGLQAAMAALHAVVLAGVDGYSPAMWTAAWLAWLETMLVVALALFISSFATTLPSIFLALALLVIGHTSWGLTMLAARHEGLFGAALRALHAILPDLSLLDVRSHVAWGVAIPWEIVAWGTLYACGYSVALLVLASALFARRDIA